MRTEAVFHLKNRLSVSLNVKENCIVKCSTPVLAIKSFKEGGVSVFLASMSWLSFKLPFCLYGHTDTRTLHIRTPNVFIYSYKHQKVKFTSVQINMKHVLYRYSD